MYASSGGAGGKSSAGYKKKGRNVSLTNIPPEVIAELVGSTPSEKNWRGVVIALAVIASILALIATAILILTPKQFEVYLGEKITFQEAMSLSKQLRHLQYQWAVCGGFETLIYLNASSGHVMQVKFIADNVSAASPATFLSKNQFSEGKIGEFQVSADCELVLIKVSSVKRFRHSAFSKFKAVRISHQEAKESPICKNKNCSSSGDILQLAIWGPTGQFLVFVAEGDIYYTANPLNTQATRITDRKGQQDISHGVASWLYEEEILQSSTAIWISKSNSHIAFLTFNDTKVQRYNMQWFGSAAAAYPQSKSIAYPKAGSRSPLGSVQLQVYDVTRNSIVKASPPAEVPDEHFVTDVRWFNATHLLVAWTDRQQQLGIFGLCSSVDGICRAFHSSRQPNGWVEFNKRSSNEPIIHAASSTMFTILHNQGFRRIAAIRVDGSRQIRWLTPSKYDVADILNFNSDSSVLYFMSCRTVTDKCDATTMHIHRLIAKGSLQNSAAAAAAASLPAECMTCSTECEYNGAKFSRDGSLLLHECLGPNPFNFSVCALTAQGSKLSAQMTIENNEKFSSHLQGKSMPRVEFRRIQLRAAAGGAGEPLEVNARFLLPKQLNDSHNTQYPLLLKLYGGPSAQLVTRKFEFGWQHYLASSLYIASVSVDGRGTANRGSEFLFAIRRNFAKVEIQDQMDAMAELQKLQFVNKSSIAVFGWSYGGFAALHLLGHPRNLNSTFCNAAIAVAPVTDFHYYNSGYTERYLGLRSTESALSYERTNISALAENFWNKDLLIAHGTGDDNVHYQNTAQLVKALVRENVDFELATYPDESHELLNSQQHLFLKMTAFLLNSYNRTSERKNFLNSKQHRYCSHSAQNVC